MFKIILEQRTGLQKLHRKAGKEKLWNHLRNFSNKSNKLSRRWLSSHSLPWQPNSLPLKTFMKELRNKEAIKLFKPIDSKLFIHEESRYLHRDVELWSIHEHMPGQHIRRQVVPHGWLYMSRRQCRQHPFVSHSNYSNIFTLFYSPSCMRKQVKICTAIVNWGTAIWTNISNWSTAAKKCSSKNSNCYFQLLKQTKKNIMRNFMKLQ